MQIDTEVPSLGEQLNRDNTELTWLEYASYLYNHENMLFTEEQCLLLSGKFIEHYEVEDIAARTNYNLKNLRNELDAINFESQVQTREAEFEVYKPIVPSEQMRLIGSIEERVGSNHVRVFITVNKTPYVSVWHSYAEEEMTDKDIFALTNYKKVNEFKTYNSYSKFMEYSHWSPENINYNNDTNIFEGELYENQFLLK